MSKAVNTAAGGGAATGSGSRAPGGGGGGGGKNRLSPRQYLAGELEVERTPQGTLAERLRAGGTGIPAFFTPAGVGSPISDGGMPWRYDADGSIAIASPPKETRVLRTKRSVMGEAINADYALVHAVLGGTDGNRGF